ncbi:Low temperature requirement protein LtrA [Micromonospora viridifaciens]|uniref:Low temperature requirement protein LtrA n=1 Tax=Micromonospora viridifaciens TaxID=1881 RepID=A0A1C4U666_MICVI|nr:low temperature requirement protein A [Micromonospora viridifaciens]SCE67109.1 Low temperature requirement protein LtrA [Micromonospora viridifaciens]
MRPERMPRGVWGVREGTRVSTTELIFDLVFVFAFIQVTTLMANNFTGRGVVRGVLLLAVLWSAWSVSAWLTTRVRADFGVMRVGFLTVMAVLFLLAVTAPEAFTDLPGGLNGPPVFAVCYLIVRALLLALLWYSLPAARSRQLAVLGGPALAGPGLILAAAFVPQLIFDRPEQISLAQIGLWMLAVAIDYLVGIGLPLAQRRIFSAPHWAERHSLIIIISLGESVISVGLAGSRLPASWPLLLSSLCGVALTAALAWIYFDVVALAGEQSLQHCRPEQRPKVARDAYTFLHLPMIIGIIFLSLGLKKELGYGSPESYRPETALGPILYSLYGSVVLFLLAQVGFQLRVARLVTTIIWPRLATAALLVGLTPIIRRMPALGVLAILTAVCITLVIVEVLVADGQRRRLREAALLEAPAASRQELAGPGAS